MNFVYFFISHLFMLTVANDCECEAEPWTSWSECPSTCGHSQRKRTRICSTCVGWTACLTCNEEDAKKDNALRAEYLNCYKDPCRKFLIISMLLTLINLTVLKFFKLLGQLGQICQLVVEPVVLDGIIE